MWMAALMLAAATPSLLPLGPLPQQKLAKGSCALFLWDRASRERIVMAAGNPTTLRVVRGGRTIDLAQVGGEGEAVLGFRPRSSFTDGRTTIALDLAILPSEGGGAVIRDGAVTVTEADLVGCS
jgi:hypothetical protein